MATKMVCVIVAAGWALCSYGGLKVQRGISYLEDCAGDAYRRERCKLDIRYSETAKGFSTVVWFHGGCLTGGQGNFIPLADGGIAQVAVNYRLLSETNGLQGADCIADAAAAVAWTLRHISEYGGDPKKVYVSGMSAGGYLTMMVGMAPKYLAAHGFKPSALAGLIPLSGQATKHFSVRKFAGDRDSKYVPKIDELAPLYWVSKDIPPILSVCGQPPWEWKCRAEENRLLIATCTALGHKEAYYVELPYCDHGRTSSGGVPYIEMFIKGRIPDNLQMGHKK